tara:strand:+ start:10642 stop:12168 length:1527 start_codon:yes stop_codon:yes gene_type:complete
MAIKRYFADADTSITNAYKPNLTERGVSGNMGQSDILEVFSIYAQESTSSSELERILIKFPVTGSTSKYMSYDREQSNIPESGSVSFYLRMFNARHSQTTPKNFDLIVSAVSSSRTTAWDEGTGLDMENYSDEYPANWTSAVASSSADGGAWTAEGGDFYTDTSSSFTASFDSGFEDINLDITPLVEQWINSSGNVLGSKSNHGLLIKLDSAQEDAETSYYTKKFFARGSQYFFKRPYIEARWDSSKKDDRGNFYYSSSLAPAEDNLNTIYLYNYVRGQLKNIPAIGTGSIFVSIFSGSSDNTEPSASKLALSAGGGVVTSGHTNITGAYVSTGIYSASFAFTGSTSLTRIFDVWHKDHVEYFTSSIDPKSLTQVWSGNSMNPNQQFVSKITNLKSSYSTQNTSARFRLYTRKKDWSPSIYSVASQDAPIDLVEDSYYKVSRVNDDCEVISYGTGSDNNTRLCFDTSGSYFDLDMSLLEADNTYSIKFVFYLNGQYVEQEEEFKFRVD